MKPSLSSHLSRHDRGVALVLVLCFIVLITGLVVAYFSRTLTTRQLANASASATQAEILAGSATDVILSDLKQEIADGSIASTPPPTLLPGGATVYFPTRAAHAVPQRNPFPSPTPATAPAPAVGPMPNLVRRSLRKDSSGGTNAAPSPAPPTGSRASAVASDLLTNTGRNISKARWNRHYLIPTATPAPSASPAVSGSLNASNPVAEFTAPDWVFVTAEKGPDELASPFKDTSGAAVTPTGRYAYAIYDEGGLLDANHTGFPSASTLPHIGAKPAPSYADLTQLPLSPTVSTALTTANVDNLLGWRNYATLQPTDTFPTLKPSASLADTAYFGLFTLTSAPPSTQVPYTVWNDKTDQAFLSRQQLISYFTKAGLDLRYLQYLGTFSRGLNQPSYLPEHSTASLAATRRPVLPANAGGNDSAANTGITPIFLAARVLSAFTRNDNTQAVVGEPLVKKRFDLNRLAWLTYKGPSADRNLGDPDMVALIAAGIKPEFLKQGTGNTNGTTGNIAKYFGLTWNATTKWTYVNSTAGILNVYNPSKGTADVAHQNREPDFFELLKASINPGSIAKASLNPNIGSNHAAQDQYKRDASLDIAVLQIGANIIDQFDTDGFPTQINYNNMGLAAMPGTVYGDENLPYISRVRNGLLRLVPADPSEKDTGTDPGTYSKPVKNTGVAALMNYPEIWNLHDWDANALSQSVGTVAPKNFKIYAQTNSSDNLRQGTTVYVWNQPLYHNSMDADVGKSPGFQDTYHFPFGLAHQAQPQGGELRYLSEKNTAMTFVLDPVSAPSEALFREPTILFMPGVPAGSQLASPTLVASNNGGTTPEDGLGHLAENPSFFASSNSSGGLISAAGASAPAYNKIPAKGGVYIGFYLGAHPLRWWDDNNNDPRDLPVYQTQFGPVNDVIYTLACEDGLGTGNYITYDLKPLTTGGAPDADLNNQLDSGFGFNGTINLDRGVRYYQTVDPRTSRFGMVDPWISTNKNSIPPRQGYSTPNQTSLAQGVFETDRKDKNSGTSLWLDLLSKSDWFPPAMGWYPGSGDFSNDGFRPGLFTQNNPNVTPDGVIAPGLADEFTSHSSYTPFYYADPDGVVRRATGGNVDGAAGVPASTLTGLPMAYAKAATGTGALANSNNGYNSSGTPAAGSDYPIPGTNPTSAIRQMDSRPSILNRPFRSVAELGYVYSGTPWKNLDFFQPESGDSALLDVFCVNDLSDGNAMTAGQVNLNTRQVPVLQAILAQASKDQWNDSLAHFAITGTAASGQAQQLAQLLVKRTGTATGPTSGPNANAGAQPLQNVSDLVGRWVKQVSASNGGIDGKASCDGFATDLATYLATGAGADQPMHNIQRFGESAVRALANAGQTRVWNLMFDVVAQTGRFPTQAQSLVQSNVDQFNVEGEQHYWVHVAIDRYTGQILDKQVEVVKE